MLDLPFGAGVFMRGGAVLLCPARLIERSVPEVIPSRVGRRQAEQFVQLPRDPAARDEMAAPVHVERDAPVVACPRRARERIVMGHRPVPEAFARPGASHTLAPEVHRPCALAI